jgi:hypothetical protein
MRTTALLLVLGLAYAGLAHPQSAAKQNIMLADQLPRRMYSLPKLPTELVAGPLDYLTPLADLLDHDIATDLSTPRIAEKNKQHEMLTVRCNVAMLHGRWTEVRTYAAQIRTLQEKVPGYTLDHVINEAIAHAKLQGGSTPIQNKRIQNQLTKRYHAMKWVEVQEPLKTMRNEYELASAAPLVTGLQAQANLMAKNNSMRVPADLLANIIHARVQLEVIGPHRSAVLAALDQVIDNKSKFSSKPSIWAARAVTLPATAKANPVAIAVWDTGVDMKLFKPARQEGIAFDFTTGRQVPYLLRKLGKEQARWPQQKTWMKGMMDLRAAINSDEAHKVKLRFTSLGATELARFQEDMSTASLYAHGTHVAGIAVEGNPFAHVFAGAMHLASSTMPARPTAELSKATANAYQQFVQAFKANGVRVVNMSWGDHPSHYEEALSYHGVGKDGEERKRLAHKLFAIERDALKTALESAPGILFVAAAGNGDGHTNFEDYIPASFTLPNLITVGAVDQSGAETSFSATGKTVTVHANGVEVESMIPGGDRVKFSGTSMAAPQVANLAAKLWALQPDLVVAQVKELILKGAERKGRVSLINPKKTLE